MTDSIPLWKQELDDGWRISPKGNPHVKTARYSATVYPDKQNAGSYSRVIIYAGGRKTYSKGRCSEVEAMESVYREIESNFGD